MSIIRAFSQCRRTAPKVLAAASLAFLTGCTILPGLNVNPERDADRRDLVMPYTLLPITPSIVAELDERYATRSEVQLPPSLVPLSAVQDNGYEYRLGPGDVLNVVVWEHPELTNPGNELRDTTSAGRLIDPEGYLFYPYVGRFRAEGMTLSQVREHITEKLTRVIRSPQVDIRVLQYRSQKVFVTGEVQQPGVIPLNDVPRGVLDIINEVGGLSETASRRIATLSRQGETHLINLHALYARGDNRYNIALREGDLLHIPDNSADKVFVLGEVGQQGGFPINRNFMTLTEAVAAAEGMEALSANDGSVFVFRSGAYSTMRGLCDCEPDEPLVFGLDMSRTDGILLADRFELQPRDVVYVSSTTFAKYNRIISQILPTVSTVFQLDRLINE